MRKIKEAIQEFITFITREANQICHRDSRNKLTHSAMAALGFHNYLQPLLLFINKHRSYPLLLFLRKIKCLSCHHQPSSTIQKCFSSGGQGSSTVGSYVPSPPMLDIDNNRDYSQMRDYLTTPHLEFDPFN
ncbi:hypothetical protein C2S52_014091 [Perilla frutescens var. hirtella]|nr:hypothetical protein C2S51_016314 [Perilla frutescens var. frutescens]KAH6776530.1 hypothetical protein C2S52_014091 [Perilla frutescens var. hirtella]